ncbi:hypothetical protein AB6A40_008306 [Gnathostoma spinigerum]|uniref:Uncharacterized protein n=1 Tax=Gnathostoma spinigerum TaxID=75299 RepID=A0ABD6ER26_9BILA
MRPISFLNLQRIYHPQSIMMSDVTPRKLSHSPSWNQRPLTDELLSVAVDEARCLVLTLYRLMNSLIPNHLRAVFEEKCIESLLASPNRPPPVALSNNGNIIQYRNSQRRAVSNGSSVSANNGSNIYSPPPPASPSQQIEKCDVSTQTFSTGEINVIHVYYD